LTKEKLDKIAMLQMKYDIEVMHLAEECNMEPEFVKNILKDFREPAFKKLRKCRM
ncbi:11772_t:CDS:2, partial [Rhizophagus irregularis]